MRKETFLIVFALSVFIGHAQQETTANWIFGNGAGINFSNGSPRNISGSNIRMNTAEGCASISDSSGNLLFYIGSPSINASNLTVWTPHDDDGDGFDDVMQNGENLIGNSSATQSTIILPKPNDSNIYYIFTVDSDTSSPLGPIPNRGLNYYTIDLSLNEGKGAVIGSGVRLLDNCSEKITAVRSSDCTSIWVIAYSSQDGFQTDFLFTRYNTFHSFEISAAGVNDIAITSPSSVPFQTDGRGYMKVNPDGDKLAIAHTGNGEAYLYNFDKTNGTASSPIPLSIPTSDLPYGVEFSPNGKRLYLTTYNSYESDTTIPNDSRIWQYNLESPTPQNSVVLINEILESGYRNAIQLALDGKIYITEPSFWGADGGENFLSVIHNPDELGINSNYEESFVNLGSGIAHQGLPPFIQSFFDTIDIIQNGVSSTQLNLCLHDPSHILRADYFPRSEADYFWYKNGVSIPSNASNPYEFIINTNIADNSLYEVKVIPKNGDCPIEGNALVNINNLPIANDIIILQCDIDSVLDNRTIFNINNRLNDITGGADDIQVNYYSDLSAAQSKDVNFLIDGSQYENIFTNQKVYAHVLNTETGCENFCTITLSVSSNSLNSISIPPLCDDDGEEDGITNIRLQDANSNILLGLPSGLEITYYETREDALLENNPLDDIAYRNENSPYNHIVYARIVDINDCFGITEVELTVNELPNIEKESEVIYCLNTFPNTISLDAAVIGDLPNNYTYTWSTGETTYDIEINNLGIYRVQVTSIATGCTRERIITVSPSNIATIDDIEIIDASQNNTITVIASGEGDYEYSLNDEFGPYQDNNVFENVNPGIHTIYIRDKNNCGITNAEISVIGFPKFFTPNGDGQNDTWQVSGVSSLFQPNTKIQIFDRYGKLLSEITPSGLGWDGTFGGSPLPVSDYWYKVFLEDGRLLSGHFTLKR